MATKQKSTEVKAGAETTEFKCSRSAGLMAWLGMVIGIILSVGPAIMDMSPAGSKIGMVVGVVVICATQAKSFLTDSGYIKSRTRVKVAETLKEEKK